MADRDAPQLLNLTLPPFFKGLAVFTPGGDLVYCIDPQKRGHWHLQLCIALQDLLHLSDPPLFLGPSFTATVDRWQDPRTQQAKISAEAHARVWRYRPLLNVIFGTQIAHWQLSFQPEGLDDPLVILSYREQFPQLWENHQLVCRLDQVPYLHTDSQGMVVVDPVSGRNALATSGGLSQAIAEPEMPESYVLRLFVAGSSVSTAHILERLHRLLDEALQCPYTLQVIDVSKYPEQAERDHISATPTLVRVWPTPVRRLVGAVDQSQKILGLLNLKRYSSETLI
ncbi:circadian clock protein KaiB [Synechococcales cyanobacterium C]|uniref:Circadian clock protein KaiB n=1 Tax=Petrachloros mirabilis ULC683 TaxID=2781853 RepID=A0A8K1ZVU4_9CYAN|nr:circadian clock KaiB family protein [Petrachloros mirabilis]NCJ05068.1 circadian clock protein KaiB [Petrachloros mirabilis ULC683]